MRKGKGGEKIQGDDKFKEEKKKKVTSQLLTYHY